MLASGDMSVRLLHSLKFKMVRLVNPASAEISFRCLKRLRSNEVRVVEQFDSVTSGRFTRVGQQYTVDQLQNIDKFIKFHTAYSGSKIEPIDFLKGLANELQ
jgi:hypothetical protein